MTPGEDVVAADDMGKKRSEPSPFDVRTIKDLVSLMRRSDLNEIDLQEGDKRIRLRRGLRSALPPAAALPAPAPAVPQAVLPAAPAPEKPAKNLTPIKSPTIGTFYVALKPGGPPCVTVGTRVTPTTVVGVIEAMKVFHEIPAECTGVIAEILVENQQPVEYGQMLFQVDPTA
jgi:acetyl-CoA carboxylase biotin carboxyl carrier protein